MKPDKDRLAYLFDRYVQKACSYEEFEELLAMQADPRYTASLEELCEAVYLQLPLVDTDTDWEGMYETIARPATSGPATAATPGTTTGGAPDATPGTATAATPDATPGVETAATPAASPVRRLPVLKRPWLRYAAVILLIAGIGTWLATRQKGSTPDKPVATAPAGEIGPGGNKAILTLADGSSILLNEAADGQLTQQGNTAVVKLNTGRLVYRIDPQNITGREPLYNKLTTPRGGQYQVTLPDGTKVWLNAASSITFPTAFTGNERKVEVSGEVYMEVAQHAARPFRVTVGSMEINVLGTSFNINAYEDEPVIRTTLLSGSVTVHYADRNTLLKPGEAIILGNKENVSGKDEKLQVVKADLDQAIAWKEGLFNFSDATLPAMLRQLSRWYDVEVVYQGKMPERKFGGKMQRDLNLSQVLNILRTMQINFSVEGRKLIVKP